MTQPTDRKLPDAPHQLTLLDEGWLYAGTDGTLYRYDPGSGASQPIQKLLPEMGDDDVVRLSPCGERLFVHVPSKKTCFLLGYVPEKGKFSAGRKLTWEKLPIGNAGFSPSGRHLLCGNEMGRTRLYSSGGGTLFQTLPKRKDAVTAITFNPPETLAAYGSFDKSVMIYDIRRYAVTATFMYGQVPTAFAFLPGTSLLAAGGRDNRVILYDYGIRKNRGAHLYTGGWPSAILAPEGERLLLVGDLSGNLYAVPSDRPEESPEPLYKEEGPVLSIQEKEGEIVVAWGSGLVRTLPFRQLRLETIEAIEKGDIPGAAERIGANPLLRHTRPQRMMAAKFDESQRNIMKLLGLGEDAAALKLAQPFFYEKEYADRYAFLKKMGNKIHTFTRAVKKKEYAKAYGMAADGDFYRHLPAFEQLETDFATQYKLTVAILASPAPDMGKAKGLLAPFGNVDEKRRLTAALFQKPQPYIQALAALRKENFALLNRLALKHPPLKESPLFHEYALKIQAMEDLFRIQVMEGEWNEAFKTGKEMEKQYPEAAMEMAEEIQAVKLRISFRNAVEKNSWLIASNLVTRHPFLYDMDGYEKLHAVIDGRLDHALRYAGARKFEAMDKIVQPFLKNRHFQAKAVSIYRTYYLAELSAKGNRMDEEQWSKAIHNYVLRFGKDDELEELAEENFMEELYEVVDPIAGNFTKYPVIASILV